MLLIGNNTLTLNAATVCAIVAKHLNESMGYSYTKESEIKVNAVIAENDVYSFDVAMVNKNEQKAVA